MLVYLFNNFNLDIDLVQDSDFDIIIRTYINTKINDKYYYFYTELDSCIDRYSSVKELYEWIEKIKVEYNNVHKTLKEKFIS